MPRFPRMLALATTVALAASLAPAASPDLPPLAGATVEAVGAHARDRAAHGEFAQLRDELAKALAPLARESDLKRLASKVDAPATALAIAQHRLLAADVMTLAEITKEDRGAEFTQWLLTDLATLEELFATGAPSGDLASTLRILFRIRSSDESSASGLPRRIAVAVALEHAKPILPWSEWDDQQANRIDAVARYTLYRGLWSTRRLFACFDELATWELRRVVDLPLYDEDILWFHESMPDRLKDATVPLRSQAEIGNAAHLVPYRDTSPTNGKSVQLGKPFYDDKRLTPAVMLEYGGVCGAVSKFGSFAARAFGVPAQPLGQEGHCALCWKATPTAWRTGNCDGESDWSTSNLHGLWGTWTARGAMIPLMASLQADPAFATSQRLLAVVALGDADPRKRLARELDVAEVAATNAYVWRAIAERLVGLEDAKIEDLRRFAEALMRGMAPAPQVGLDILASLEAGKAFRSASIKDRERYVSAWIDAFADAVTDPKAFAGGERGLRLAFREMLGHAVWSVSGKTGSLGEWPYLAHGAILDGTHGAWKEWWAGAAAADRLRVTDLLTKTATGLPKRPELAEQALARLVTLAEADESLRAKAQRAAESIGESFAKSGRRDDALRVYRLMILAGERLGHRSWIRGFSDRAIAIREGAAAAKP